jgi:hypothetical protein
VFGRFAPVAGEKGQSLVKETTASGWRAKLAACAAAIVCAVAANLVGAVPAFAQPQGTPELTVSATVSRIIASPSGSPALKVSCAVGIGHYDRTHECWLESLTFTFYKDKVPVGDTVVALFQYVTLRGTGLAWSEEDVVTAVDSTGETAPISGTLSVSCGGGPCLAAASFAPAPITIGSNGSVAYGDRLAVGEYVTDMFNTYTLDYEAPPYIPVSDNASSAWSSPWPYRCDNGVAVAKSAGCVVPAAVPTLTLSIKQAGASAAMFRWAQQHMSAHWGLKGKGAELTRASGTADANERVICRGFKKQGTVIVKGGKNDKDSCDEFPFASTGQSGAPQLVKEHKTGAACVQLQAVRTANSGSEAAQWGNVKVIGTPDYGAVCVRGHIPLRLNSSTGGSYGTFIEDQRLFAGDGFWVAVTG